MDLRIIFAVIILARSGTCVSKTDFSCLSDYPLEADSWNQPVSVNEGIVKMVPHPTICSKYYLCLGSITVQRKCAEGLLFDVETNGCTYPENARCYLDPRCPEKDVLEDLRFYSDPENCAKYSVCYNGALYPLYCSEGLFFNIESQECTLPGWSNCEVRGVYCPIESEYVPHPSKCQSYYECEIGFAFYRECEDGYYFSEDELSCVPNNGECKPLTTSTSTERPTTIEITTISLTQSSSTTTTEIVATTESTGAAIRFTGGFNFVSFVTGIFSVELFMSGRK